MFELAIVLTDSDSNVTCHFLAIKKVRLEHCHISTIGNQDSFTNFTPDLLIPTELVTIKNTRDLNKLIAVIGAVEIVSVNVTVNLL